MISCPLIFRVWDLSVGLRSVLRSVFDEVLSSLAVRSSFLPALFACVLFLILFVAFSFSYVFEFMDRLFGA